MSDGEGQALEIRRVRALLGSLRRAAIACRLHGERSPARFAAFARLRAAATGLPPHHGLEIRLFAGAAWLHGVAVLRDGRDRTLAHMGEAGVGRILIAPDAPPDTFVAWAEELGRSQDHESPERDVVARLRRRDARGLRLLAPARRDEQAWTIAPVYPWCLLPAIPTVPDTDTALTRELCRNLPAAAARQVVVDLDQAPWQNADAALAVLVDVMLERGDVHAAACVLLDVAAAERDPYLMPALLDRILSRVDADYVQRQLAESGDGLLPDLMSLGVHAGPRALHALRTALQREQRALPAWLPSAIPGPQ